MAEMRQLESTDARSIAQNIQAGWEVVHCCVFVQRCSAMLDRRKCVAIQSQMIFMVGTVASSLAM